MVQTKITESITVVDGQPLMLIGGPFEVFIQYNLRFTPTQQERPK